MGCPYKGQVGYTIHPACAKQPCCLLRDDYQDCLIYYINKAEPGTPMPFIRQRCHKARRLHAAVTE